MLFVHQSKASDTMKTRIAVVPSIALAMILLMSQVPVHAKDGQDQGENASSSQSNEPQPAPLEEPATLEEPAPPSEEEQLQVVSDPTGEFYEYVVDVDLSGQPLDEMGFRAFRGQPSSELTSLSDAISEYISGHEEYYAGSAFLSDYTGIEIYYKSSITGFADVKSGLQEILDSSPAGSQVRLVPVENSLVDLESAVEIIQENTAESADAIEGYGIAITQNSVTIDVNSDLASVELLESLVDEGTIEGISAGPDSDVIVPLIRIDDSTVATTEATRLSDTSPFYMGGRIKSASNNTGSTCSLGTPITIKGKFYVMTAGHCTASSWWNPNGKFVGSQYTTAYSANPAKSNLPKYGDWKLLTGTQYSMRVFTGALSSSATMPISSGTTARRAVGSELCKSGSVTASHCRLIVLETRASRKLGDQYSAYTTRVRYDPNRNGAYACGASQGGDSGGMYYYANGNGGVISYGIHRGKTYTNTNPISHCIYHAVENAGVVAWNSNAWVN